MILSIPCCVRIPSNRFRCLRVRIAYFGRNHSRRVLLNQSGNLLTHDNANTVIVGLLNLYILRSIIVYFYGLPSVPRVLVSHCIDESHIVSRRNDAFALVNLSEHIVWYEIGSHIEVWDRG